MNIEEMTLPEIDKYLRDLADKHYNLTRELIEVHKEVINTISQIPMFNAK